MSGYLVVEGCEMVRVLVTGGRDFHDAVLLFAALDHP